MTTEKWKGIWGKNEILHNVDAITKPVRGKGTSAPWGRPNHNPLPFCPSAAFREENDSGSNGLSKVKSQNCNTICNHWNLKPAEVRIHSFGLTAAYFTHLCSVSFKHLAFVVPWGSTLEWLQACAAESWTHFQHTSSKTRAVAVTVRCTSASVNGSGTKGLPDNGFTDVGGNKEGNTRPQAVTLL